MKLGKEFQLRSTVDIVERRDLTEIEKTAISREKLVFKFNDIPFQTPHGMGKKMA